MKFASHRLEDGLFFDPTALIVLAMSRMSGHQGLIGGQGNRHIARYTVPAILAKYEPLGCVLLPKFAEDHPSLGWIELGMVIGIRSFEEFTRPDPVQGYQDHIRTPMQTLGHGRNSPEKQSG